MKRITVCLLVALVALCATGAFASTNLLPSATLTDFAYDHEALYGTWGAHMVNDGIIYAWGGADMTGYNIGDLGPIFDGQTLWYWGNRLTYQWASPVTIDSIDFYWWDVWGNGGTLNSPDLFQIEYNNGGSWTAVGWQTSAWGAQTKYDSPALVSHYDLSSSFTTDALRLTYARAAGWTTLAEMETFGTRIPEPGTLLALGSGLLGLCGFIRRKK